jgi:integrase
MVKFQHLGRRQAFSLHTASAEEAALKAKPMYQRLVANGWATLLDAARPPPPEPTVGLTFGSYIALIRSKNVMPEKTLNGYVQRLRRIVAEIKSINRNGKRHRPGSKGRAEVIARIEAVPLAAITPDDVRQWKRRALARAGSNTLKRQQVSVSVNSMLRQARSLFSERKVLRHLPEIPRPLPFDGVEFEPRVSTKFYGAGIEAPELVRRASAELAEEELKAFLLAIGLGLRRREADHLQWRSFDFAAGTVRVQPTEYYELKTIDSAAVLKFDPEFMALFKGWHAKAKGAFVLESERPPRGETNYHYYRADATFDRLVEWLRAQGVTGNKPLHTCRKIYGSLIADAYGIHAASSALRHTTIDLTSAVYADRSVKFESGLGSVISGAQVLYLSVPAPRSAKPARGRQARGRQARGATNP